MYMQLDFENRETVIRTCSSGYHTNVSETIFDTYKLYFLVSALYWLTLLCILILEFCVSLCSWIWKSSAQFGFT